MIRMKVVNSETVAVNLENIADKVKEGMRQFMIRSADRVVKEAKANAPRDKWNLEESIKAKRAIGSDKRLTIAVEVGGTGPDGTNVDAYAMLVHENYEDLGGPGEGTLEKMKADPTRHIGSKFLERAADQERKNVDKRAMKEVDDIINQGMSDIVKNIAATPRRRRK